MGETQHSFGIIAVTATQDRLKKKVFFFEMVLKNEKFSAD